MVAPFLTFFSEGLSCKTSINPFPHNDTFWRFWERSLFKTLLKCFQFGPGKIFVVWVLIEWCFTPLLTVFQSYNGDSSHYSCLSWVSPVLGWALKCLAQGHSHEKTQRIQCGSNPGPLDYESNTLPLSHVGPLLSSGNGLKGQGLKLALANSQNASEIQKLLVQSASLSQFFAS